MDFIHGPHDSSPRQFSNSSSGRYSMSSTFYPSYSFASRSNTSARRVPIAHVPSAVTAPSSPCLSISTPPPLETCLPGLATTPSTYLPPSPPASSLQKKHSQDLVPQSGESIFHQLSRHLRKHRSARPSDHHQLRITDVTPANFEAFLTSHCYDDLLKGVDLEYDALAGQIIMCPPPAPYHDCTPVFLQSVLIGLRSTPFDTPARQRTLSVREIRFRSPNGSYMVPDAAVVVLSVEGDVRVWPTIVVEVANTQAYDDVVDKVRRWFVQSDGMVEVVLVLKFTAKDPLLEPACYLETWRYRDVVPDDIGDGDAQMDLECDGSGTNRSASDDEGAMNPDTTAPPNRDAAQGEGESAISVDPESDSSLSSLDDEDDANDEALLAPPDNDADDSPFTNSSSSDSTGDYDPHPTHEIFLAGPRKTVLPVADPPDPEMLFLTLRYSDFFGSENVPPGRDPDEQVLLDLDELRQEIAMLIRLTAKQEEPVKRQAGSGGAAPGGRGKRVRR